MFQILITMQNTASAKSWTAFLKRYFGNSHSSCQIIFFRSYEKCEQYIQKTNSSYDTAFIDFSDPAAGRRLAAMLMSEEKVDSWICCLGTERDCLESLYLRPSAYMGQELTYEAFFKVFHKLVQEQSNLKRYFSFKLAGEWIRIPQRRIEYFESNGKKVVLHIKGSERPYSFNARLDDLIPMLSQWFLRCHQSYLVNMNEIYLLDKVQHVFKLLSGRNIPVSRRFYVQAAKRHIAFQYGE